MTLAEVEILRAAHWASLPPGEAVVRRFVEAFGFTRFGAFAGRDLPAISTIGAPAAGEADLYRELQDELGARRVLEVRVWPGGLVYAPRELAEYVFALVGDRRPRRDFQADAEAGRLSWLAAEVFPCLLAAKRPMTVPEIRVQLGSEGTSRLAIERALTELGARMRVLRVGLRDGEGEWQSTVDAIGEETLRIQDNPGAQHAAAALLSEWLGTMIVDSEEAMGDFFSPLLSRQRVHAALLALLGSKSIASDSLEGRTAFRLTGGAVHIP